MSKYVSPEDVEKLIQNTMVRFNKSEEEKRPAILQALKELGYTISIPLIAKIAAAQVLAGEAIVVQNVKNISENKPFLNHGELMNAIQNGQVDVAESVVIEHLKDLGI